MLESVFLAYPWSAVVFVTVLSLLDYRLSVLGHRWYTRGAHEHYDLGGSYELNPPFEDDVEAERPVSRTHVIAIVRTAVIVAGVWWFTARVDRLEGLFIGVLGFFILTQVPVQIRHIQNLALFRYVALAGGVEGRARTPRWLDLRLSGLLFWTFGGVYVLLWALTSDALFVGGAIGAALAGSRFWIFGETALKESEDSDGGQDEHPAP